MFLQKSFFTLVFALLFLFLPSTVLAHAGHDHSEEIPTANSAEQQHYPKVNTTMEATTETATTKQPTTPSWIPIATVVAGIACVGVGTFLFYPRVLHRKKK